MQIKVRHAVTAPDADGIRAAGATTIAESECELHGKAELRLRLFYLQ